jgi:hypothetical protein
MNRRFSIRARTSNTQTQVIQAQVLDDLNCATTMLDSIILFGSLCLCGSIVALLAAPTQP